MSHLRSEVNDYRIDVSRGVFAGESRIDTLGSTTINVIDAFTLIHQPNVPFVFPAVDVAMEVVSDDVNDALGGSGAEIVFILGVSGGVLTSESVNLNGVTPVALLNSYSFINEFIITQGPPVFGATTGNIDARITAGGAIQQRILAGPGARGQTCIAQVPSDETWAILEWTVYAQQNGNKTPTVDAQLIIRGATSMWAVVDYVSFDAATTLGITRPFEAPWGANGNDFIAISVAASEQPTSFFATIGAIRIKN